MLVVAVLSEQQCLSRTPELPTPPLGGHQGHLCKALCGPAFSVSSVIPEEQNSPPFVQDRYTQLATLVPWPKGQLLCGLCPFI